MRVLEDLFDERFGPGYAVRESTAEEEEVHLTTRFGSLVKSTKTRTALRHHVQREPGTVAFLVPLPVLELVLAYTLDGFGQATIVIVVVIIVCARQTHA